MRSSIVCYILAALFAWMILDIVDAVRQPKLVVVNYYNRGTITRSGEPFDKNAYTCAVPFTKMDKWYRIEFNGKVVYVYANDSKGGTGDGLDLTPSAFERLAPLDRGAILCKVEEVP